MTSFTYAIGNYVVLVDGESITVCDEQGVVNLLTVEEELMGMKVRLGLLNERINAVEDSQY